MGRIVGENKHKGTLYPVDSKAIYRIIYEVVAVLPTENIKTSVIYCVPIIGKDNEYDMFLYIDGWSKIGSGSIDLSDYYTKEEVDDIVADISTLSFKIVQEKPVEDIETNIIYLIPKSGSSAGNIYEEWIYIDNKWELLGTTDIDLSNYMTLAPLNPTAEQIAAMPNGQLYQDSVNYKGIIKGGQAYYTSEYVDGNYRKVIFHSEYRPPSVIRQSNAFRIGDIWIAFDDIDSHSYPYSTGLHRAYILTNIRHSSAEATNDYFYIWEEITSVPFGERVGDSSTLPRVAEKLSVRDYGGDLGLCLEKSKYSGGNIIWTDYLNNLVHTYRFFIVKTAECQFVEMGQDVNSYRQIYTYQELVIPKQLEEKEDVRNRRDEVSANPSNNYYPSEKCMVDYVNNKIGDIETALSEV